MTRFYGKYRGTVLDNRDPLQLARLNVTVPAISADVRVWALPCVPYAGPGFGFLALPPVDARVWVEFEGGDLDYPIWTGCFWEPGQVPAEAGAAAAVWRTPGSAIVLGRPGSADAVSATPLEVRMDDDRVVVGRAEKPLVTVSNDAVEVTIAPLALTLSATKKEVTLTSGTATVTIADGAIELRNGPTSVKVSAGQVLVRSNSIDLGAGAGRVAIGPTTVNINNGALEVT